jgi:hypothetical protein
MCARCERTDEQPSKILVTLAQVPPRVMRHSARWPARETFALTGG